MTSLDNLLKTKRLKALREGRSVSPEELKAAIARSKEIDRPLPREGFGGRKREIAAIERSRVIAINLSAAPFEWMASHNMLESKLDQPGIGNVRFSAGIKLRDLMIGAEPAGLRSANLEGSSGGGGVPVLINDFKMDCVQALAQLRADMALTTPLRRSKLKKNKRDKKTFDESYHSHRSEQFSVLERTVYREEWLLDGISNRKKKAVIEQIHNGLDQVALFFGMITQREYAARWKPQRSDTGDRSKLPAPPQ